MGRIAQMLSERQLGSLPANTQANPNIGPMKNEHVPNKDEPVVIEKEKEPEASTTVKAKVSQEPLARVYKAPIPYPQRLKKDKLASQYKKFSYMIKQISVNMPLKDVLLGMQNYGRFIKDLISDKGKYEEVSTTFLNEECSAILKKQNTPPKLGDTGSFLIPCKMGDSVVYDALADLGASINLMPYSLYLKLGLGELTPTRMGIRLADCSCSYPIGKAEDLPVGVNSFTFPTDFVILEMEEDAKVPLILGHPFLNTVDAIIFVQKKQLSIGVGDERVTFSVDKAMKYPSSSDDSCFRIDVIDNCVDDDLQELFGIDTSDVTPLGESDEFHVESELEELLKVVTDFEDKDVENFDLKEEEPFEEIKNEDRLLNVLRDHKRAIAWKTTDISGINPSFCTHKILVEDEYKPVVQRKRRLNPNMKEVVKKEVVKLLDAGLIYPISDSPWVSSVQVVPKKGGTTVVLNERNELVPTRTVTGWRVCIDYRRLNDATRKDHFPLPFIDQMLERLAGKEFYCFLDGFSGYYQIPIDPKDQEKTTFTCPYGTFAYKHMPFGLCNAPGTFQRLERMLIPCEKLNLVLNWEKCHFMVKEGIVLGHKSSRVGIEVDPAKIDVIHKLPHLTNVKAIRSFLGHAGFYRRFIKDFSKIARPLTKLLEKDIPFDFNDDCVNAFSILKEKLTHAPIMVSPDWALPFELMCDASDVALGAVLGQRKINHFQPIYYASKTLTGA
ncbi:uncharacterized protein [Rutidosis leptorrhynchoides]|uniref:uncharacterized protein n=1 Tax=Rutidosis leptorrhynchoides TaxID=125765 RepID=UPI003A9946BB